MKQIYVSLIMLVMMLGWFAVPGINAADWSRDSLIHSVAHPYFEDHFDLRLGRDRGRSESDRDRGSDSAASGKGTRSYDTPLGPSFDIPGSVDGHSRRLEPWWGRRSEGEPMLKDLKDLNRDPMRSP